MSAPGDVVTPERLGADLAARAELRRSAGGRGCGIIAIDGWSGSGKTCLAGRLAPAIGAPCVHLDDWVPGWHGLARSVELLVEWVLRPLAAGRRARWRRWDWDAGSWGAWETVAASGLLVVEGCGAGSPLARPWLSALVWIAVDDEERARRLRARPDWPTYEPWAAMWADQERALRAGDDPAATADVVVEPGPGPDDPLPSSGRPGAHQTTTPSGRCEIPTSGKRPDLLVWWSDAQTGHSEPEPL